MDPQGPHLMRSLSQSFLLPQLLGHLIHNLFAIADNLDTKGASDLTVWVSTMRRHLAIAPTYPYMMDALKAFSASQIAWLSHSQAARDQSIQYSTSALSGLHNAVGQFNKANADSVLATACLLVSQSKDWLSWSSLLGGITSITAAIESTNCPLRSLAPR